MQAEELSIAFVGAGNMARSLIQGLRQQNVPAARLRAADPVAKARAAVAATGVSVFEENADAVRDANVIVLAVKPQVAGAVVQDLAPAPDQLIVSIAAGIDLASLAAWLPADQPVVRCMPNTPALLGAGMSALFANASVSDAQRRAAEFVLDAVGETVWVNEEADLDAVTAVSGSGPAYFFLLMEAMIDAGVRMGLDAELARSLTLQTAYGAALMARASDEPPGVLRANVTSPGGTTERALTVLREGEVSETIVRALVAAQVRAAELAREFGAKR